MEPFTLGSARVDIDRRVVERRGVTERMTTLEAECLRYLVEAERDVSREELLAQVWRYSDASLSRTCDTTVRRLRTKIEDEPSHPRHLETVFGVGYRLTP